MISGEPSSRGGAHHLVLPRSGPLVVLFSGTNKADGVFDFRGYAERLNASVILLNNGLNRWYQGGVPGFGDDIHGTAKLIKDWAKSLAAPDIYCIGASMGGSAAVMYGALVGARSLAFSFEANIRLAGSRSAKYIPADYSLPYPDLVPLVRASHYPIVSVLGGDDVIDIAEANRLKHTENLSLTVLSGVDHGVPRHLRGAGHLDDCLNAFIANKPLPRLRNEALDLHVPNYSEAIMRAHETYISGDLGQCIESGRMALAAIPSSYCASLLLGRALAKDKRHGEALPYLALATQLAPSGEVEPRLLMGRCLRVAGRPEQAILLHCATLGAAPKAHRVSYDLSLAYWTLGDYASADAAIKEAIRWGGRLDNYIKRQALIAEHKI